VPEKSPEALRLLKEVNSSEGRRIFWFAFYEIEKVEVTSIFISILSHLI
jgi:hypothetical protein